LGERDGGTDKNEKMKRKETAKGKGGQRERAKRVTERMWEGRGRRRRSRRDTSCPASTSKQQQAAAAAAAAATRTGVVRTP
jgi:hypothetical protein